MRWIYVCGAALFLAGLSAAEAAPKPSGSSPAASNQSRPATPAPILPFVHDDYAGALAKARQRGVPMFVESWAPW